jgi:hypothetical protein
MVIRYLHLFVRSQQLLDLGVGVAGIIFTPGRGATGATLVFGLGPRA